MTVQYTGPESITPWIELYISFVAEDGRSDDEASVVLERDAMDLGDLYGGTAEGTLAFLIPRMRSARARSASRGS